MTDRISTSLPYFGFQIDQVTVCDSDESDQERHEHIPLVSCIYILLFTNTYNLLWSDTISDKFEFSFQNSVHKINVKTWYFPTFAW